MMTDSITRRHYDTFIRWLYRENKEHLLDRDFRKTIPYSTISSLRNTSATPSGEQYAEKLRESLTLYELVAENERLKKLIYTITYVWLTLYPAIQPFFKKSEQYHELVTDAIQRLQTVLSLETACRVFRVSRESFYFQLNKLKYACAGSPLGLCFRRHPLQLSHREVEAIKEAFVNPEFDCWPSVSIYYYLLRNKVLNIGLSTFYKYVKILGLKRSWEKKPSKTKGVETSRPNEVLHVDTTYTPCGDGTKPAVVFVTDNFSRAILSWEIAPQNAAQNIVQALKDAFKVIAEHIKVGEACTLLADGGPENNAHVVDELLKEDNSCAIRKQIARKDIQFSNSPIEAVNKIFKRYVRKYKPGNFEALKKLIPEIIEDYNRKRPHGSLNGLTPWETYTRDVPYFDFKAQIQAQKAIRMEENKRFNCSRPC